MTYFERNDLTTTTRGSHFTHWSHLADSSPQAAPALRNIATP